MPETKRNAMRRLMTTRATTMLLAAVVCAPRLLAATAADQQAYVVTLRPDASIDGVRTVAGQMAASCGGTLLDSALAGSAQDAFVIRLPQSRARVLAVDPRVQSIVPMRFTPATQAVVETVPWSSGVAYTYDGVGNISQIGNDTFVYDGVSRLTEA